MPRSFTGRLLPKEGAMRLLKLAFLAPMLASIGVLTGCGKMSPTSPEPTTTTPAVTTPQEVQAGITAKFSFVSVPTWNGMDEVPVKTDLVITGTWTAPLSSVPLGEVPKYALYTTNSGAMQTKSLTDFPNVTATKKEFVRDGSTNGGTFTIVLKDWAGCNWGVVTVINPVPCYDTSDFRINLTTQSSAVLAVADGPKVHLKYLK